MIDRSTTYATTGSTCSGKWLFSQSNFPVRHRTSHSHLLQRSQQRCSLIHVVQLLFLVFIFIISDTGVNNLTVYGNIDIDASTDTTTPTPPDYDGTNLTITNDDETVPDNEDVSSIGYHVEEEKKNDYHNETNPRHQVLNTTKEIITEESNTPADPDTRSAIDTNFVTDDVSYTIANTTSDTADNITEEAVPDLKEEEYIADKNKAKDTHSYTHDHDDDDYINLDDDNDDDYTYDILLDVSLPSSSSTTTTQPEQREVTTSSSSNSSDSTVETDPMPTIESNVTAEHFHIKINEDPDAAPQNNGFKEAPIDIEELLVMDPTQTTLSESNGLIDNYNISINDRTNAESKNNDIEGAPIVFQDSLMVDNAVLTTVTSTDNSEQKNSSISYNELTDADPKIDLMEQQSIASYEADVKNNTKDDSSTLTIDETYSIPNQCMYVCSNTFWGDRNMTRRPAANLILLEKLFRGEIIISDHNHSSNSNTKFDFNDPHTVSRIKQRNIDFTSTNNSYSDSKLIDVNNNEEPEKISNITKSPSPPQILNPAKEDSSMPKETAPSIAKNSYASTLNDIDDFFEDIDLPDEFDVGTIDASIQEVMIGSVIRIAMKRTTVVGRFVLKHVRKGQQKVFQFIKGIVEDHELFQNLPSSIESMKDMKWIPMMDNNIEFRNFPMKHLYNDNGEFAPLRRLRNVDTGEWIFLSYISNDDGDLFGISKENFDETVEWVKVKASYVFEKVDKVFDKILHGIDDDEEDEEMNFKFLSDENFSVNNNVVAKK